MYIYLLKNIIKSSYHRVVMFFFSEFWRFIIIGQTKGSTRDHDSDSCSCSVETPCLSPETYNFERLVGVENKMNDLKLSRESKADAKSFLEATRKKWKMTGKVFRSVCNLLLLH